MPSRVDSMGRVDNSVVFRAILLLSFGGFTFCSLLWVLVSRLEVVVGKLLLKSFVALAARSSILFRFLLQGKVSSLLLVPLTSIPSKRTYTLFYGRGYVDTSSIRYYKSTNKNPLQRSLAQWIMFFCDLCPGYAQDRSHIGQTLSLSVKIFIL